VAKILQRRVVSLTRNLGVRQTLGRVSQQADRDTWVVRSRSRNTRQGRRRRQDIRPWPGKNAEVRVIIGGGFMMADQSLGKRKGQPCASSAHPGITTNQSKSMGR